MQIVPPICCKCRLRASRWLILDVHLLKLAKDPDVKQGRGTDGFGFQSEAQMEAEMAMLAETHWFHQQRRAHHDKKDCFGIAAFATIAC
jgi:hypothetical protein